MMRGTGVFLLIFFFVGAMVLKLAWAGGSWRNLNSAESVADLNWQVCGGFITQELHVQLLLWQDVKSCNSYFGEILRVTSFTLARY